MPAPFFPISKCYSDATDARAALALSVLKLFKSGFVPTADTLDTDLYANECDYTTYAPGTITAWLAPVRGEQTGYQISAPTVQFALSADPAVTNMVGGYWLENAAGDVQLIRQFDVPVPMVEDGNYVQISPTIIFPTGR